jgi:hypothetical protein
MTPEWFLTDESNESGWSIDRAHLLCDLFGNLQILEKAHSGLYNRLPEVWGKSVTFGAKKEVRKDIGS